MKQKISTIFIALVAGIIGSYGFYTFAPLSLIEDTPVLGSAITVIQGSDTLSSSRSVINANFAALNTSKAEISDVSGTTTLSSLASVGTITSGTWNASAVTVPYGGTGSTTLSSNQVILGNGTGAVKTVVGFGNSGQSLVSNGAGLAPTWQSITFDTTLPYTNTGAWTFSTATTTLSANTSIACTAANPIRLNSVFYVCPPSAGASSTVLSIDGSGRQFWVTPDVVKKISDGAAYTTSNTSTTTLKAISFSANEVSTNARICITGNFLKTANGANASGRFALLFADNSATSTILADVGVAHGRTGYFETCINNRNSATSQSVGGWTYDNNTSVYIPVATSTSINTGAAFHLVLQGRAGNGSDTWGFSGITVTVVN